jgi:hypothetical protein
MTDWIGTYGEIQSIDWEGRGYRAFGPPSAENHPNYNQWLETLQRALTGDFSLMPSLVDLWQKEDHPVLGEFCAGRLRIHFSLRKL